MKIGLLGGTGIEGKGLALRFAAAGASVVIGSRSEDQASRVACECNSLLEEPIIRGTRNQSMVEDSDLVFLTVASDQALSAVKSVEFSEEQVLVDVTVPMKVGKSGVDYLEPSLGSNSEMIAGAISKSVHVIGAFKTIPAHILADLQTSLDCNVFICGDSMKAKERVTEAAGRISSLRPLDAGPLKAARTLERMTVLAVHLNRLYRRRGVRFNAVGI